MQKKVDQEHNKEEPVKKKNVYEDSMKAANKTIAGNKTHFIKEVIERVTWSESGDQ